MHNLSYWEKNSFLKAQDFLIVGSGIVGLSLAIRLKELHPKSSVLILERGILPWGASTKNAGFTCIGSPSELLDDLSNASEDEVFDTVMKRWNGLVNLKSMLGADQIGFQNLGSHELFTEKDNHSYQEVMDQLVYLNKMMDQITGIDEVFSSRDAIIDQSGFSGYTHAVKHAAEGQIDTGRMMKCLLHKTRTCGVEILNGVEVLDVKQGVVNTSLGKIEAKTIAVCTNGFAKELLGEIDLEPARAQVIISQPIDQLKVKGIFHFDRGYYYFRNVGNRILFGGARNIDIDGERTTEMQNTNQLVLHLEEILKQQICPAKKVEIDYSWAGIMGVGSSKAPIVKEIKEGIYCAVRLGGMGLAIGSLIGKELAEKMFNFQQ